MPGPVPRRGAADADRAADGRDPRGGHAGGGRAGAAAGDPSNAAARARAIATVTGYGEPEYDADAVNADLALRRTFLEREVVLAGAQLAVEAKEWFLAQAVRIGLADGQLGEGERQACTASRTCSACPARTRWA